MTSGERPHSRDAQRSKVGSPRTPRQRNEAKFKTERRRWAKVKKVRPVRDPFYLNWIRTLPCLVCMGWEELRWRLAIAPFTGIVRSEAAHTGPHGIGTKSSDRSVVPLCEIHHREGKSSYHNLGKKFFAFHKVDVKEVTKRLGDFYDGGLLI